MNINLDYTMIQWLLLITVAILVGLGKAGLNATVMLAVPLLTSIVSGKASSGMMLSMFIVADIIAVIFYVKHTQWKVIRSLAPWVVVGVFTGGIVGRMISDAVFGSLISVIALICLALLVLLEVKKDNLKVPDQTWFYALTGIVCGFTSMIGNLAGPIFAVYLLAKGFEKKNYVGTVAIFFFMMNLIKLPLQITMWQNFSKETLLTVAAMVPFLIGGVFVGKKVIFVMNEKVFRYVILTMTAIVSLKLLLF